MTAAGAARGPHEGHIGPRRAVVAAFAAVCLSLGGCAQLAPLPSPAVNEALAGRLSIRVEPVGSTAARAFSAAFDLRGDPSDGVLGLSTPLGSMLARASWKPGEVLLVTPQEQRRFVDLDALTREVLGESVPVAAWFDWLHGRPWPEAASSPASISAGTGTVGFEQLGWAVDVSRLADGRVVAVRERPAPGVTVRIQLDRS